MIRIRETEMSKRALIILLCVAMLLPTVLFSCQDTGEDNSETFGSESDTESTPTEKETEKETEMDYEGFVITKANKDNLKIICSAEKNSKAYKAAEDLRTHLKKITGWTVPILLSVIESPDIFYIVVGANEITEGCGYECESGYPGKESVTVLQKDNFVFLMGNDDGEYNGTQFAVNLFLEKLGCGWFAEGSLWTVIPKLDVLDLNIGEIYNNFTPRFSSRTTRVLSATPNLAHRWYQGGDRTLTGHWLYQVVPASEYAEHPEWYGLSNGTRDPAGKTYWQFCYSNKEFADRIAEEAIEKFNSSPSLISLTISANDGWDENWCECENCKSLGNASDAMVHFANNVAEKVFAAHPDRRLQIYSYHYTFTPPVNSVKLHEMVELMLCRETNMYKPLDEDFMMPAGRDPVSHIEFTQSWRQNALEYIEKTQPTHLSIWDWYCISAEDEGWRNAPWVQGEVAIRNQKLYEELGAEYVYYDHGPTDGYNEPNTQDTYALRWPLWYVAAKAAFDGSLDEREILGDACDKLYGAASEMMLEYYLMLSDISKECDAYSNTWIPAKVSEVYPIEKKREIRALAKEIREKAKTECTAAEQNRIESQLKYWL